MAELRIYEKIIKTNTYRRNDVIKEERKIRKRQFGKRKRKRKENRRKREY